MVHKFHSRHLNRLKYGKLLKLDSYSWRLLKIKLVSNLTSITLLILGVFALISVVLFFWYSRDLPSPDKVKRKTGFSTVLLDRTGKPIYDIYSDQNRIPISLSEIPESLKKATIAIEDKNFYSHQGFDPKGIVRSAFNTITFRGLQGGSTLTQQLVKNVLLSSERTLPRKIKEFILSIQIERKYSKDEILQMYLNEAPYGGTMWGIESAAEGYFGKHAKDLDFLESIILAGLPQRPSYYTPYGPSPKAYLVRAEEVLRRLREDNIITQSQEAEYKRNLPNVKFISNTDQSRAWHFVEYVKKQLSEQFGDALIEKSGLQVTTTLDSDLQSVAEKITFEELEKLKGLSVSNGAVLVIDPNTGEILSYVGSKEYNSQDETFQGKFDVVSMGFRQPGSALKPITYAAAFNKGYTPSYLLMDVETRFHGGADNKDYIPKNYDNKFRGPVQLRYALSNSINIPAVKLTALTGIKDILKTASDMGITTLAPTDDNVKRFGLSLTLGGGEVRLLDLSSAYGVFATGGIKHNSVAILKITDSNGKTLYEYKPGSGKRVLNEDVSFLISNILSDNDGRKEVFGLNSYLYIPGHDVAVKTGTTDDKRDNWTVGYTTSIVVGVWVGNNDNSPMNPKLASGVTGAAPIWNRIIKEVIKKYPEASFHKPDNVMSLDIDAFGGGLPHEGRPTRKEYFIKGTDPTSVAPIYQKLKLSKTDNKKLANSVEIATGAYDEKEFIVFREDDPTSLKGSENMWQKGIDEWLSSQNDSSYYPPTDSSTNNENQVVVRIKNPQDKQEVNDENVNIEADAKAVKDITKIEVYVDGTLKTSVNNSYFNDTLHLDKGVHTLKIKAYDSDKRSGESSIIIGVKVPADISSTPNPTVQPPSITATPPTPTPII